MAAVPHVVGKMSLARCDTAGVGQAGGHVGVQDLRAERVRVDLPGPGRELRVGEEHRLVPRRRRRAQRLDREEEEDLFLRHDRAADGRREVVGVERIVLVVRPHEHGVREHAVVVVVVADQPVEPLRSRLGGADHLDRAAAAVLGREGVDLDARLLDRVGVRRQVQHALTDAARHVEPVDDELVGDRALAVGAGVDGRFGRVVVDARSRRAGAARLSAAHRAEPGDARRLRHEPDEAAARHRQVGQRLGLERQLVARLRDVDERGLAADGHGLLERADLEPDREVQRLVGLQRHGLLGALEPLRFGRDLVRAGREAQEPVVARAVRGRGRGDLGGEVEHLDPGAGDAGRAGVFDDPLDVRGVLRVGRCRGEQQSQDAQERVHRTDRRHLSLLGTRRERSRCGAG